MGDQDGNMHYNDDEFLTGSNPMTPRPPISAPPSQFHSPSMSRSPLLLTPDRVVTLPPSANRTPRGGGTPRTGRATPRTSWTPRFITPLGSPLRKALHLTKLDPNDAWLPITESRNGNAFYAAFHCLCSGIGIQALVLPVAFTVLGWTWGIICLALAFIWQLYTLYILVQLHESVETGIRYSRYLQLAAAAFGDRLANVLALAPIMNLSGGTCTALIIIGGSTSKLLFQTICGATCSANQHAPTTVEWYLIFTFAAALLSQLPNLNSIAGVSLVGSITAIGYCTLIWAISVAEGRVPGVSYNPVSSGTDLERAFAVLNALGIVAFAFRGHNLVLEIQATMPSSEKHPSTVPMWKGVKVAYTLIATCLFPLAIGGYWAYGQLIPAGGMLTALFAFHGQDTSRFILGLTSFFVVVNALSSFQLYAMPIFDQMESSVVTKTKKACPRWLRSGLRVFFAFVCFFIAVAIPFLGSVAGLIGGISLPVTLAYPCFMWLKVKKPARYSSMWVVNWGLGVFGLLLSGALIVAGVYVVVDNGIEFNFFKPQ
ncbi:Lysine histidine transporter-like 8 [Linum grandiflorum]